MMHHTQSIRQRCPIGNGSFASCSIPRILSDAMTILMSQSDGPPIHYPRPNAPQGCRGGWIGVWTKVGHLHHHGNQIGITMNWRNGMCVIHNPSVDALLEAIRRGWLMWQYCSELTINTKAQRSLCQRYGLWPVSTA